jgi:hypothetical protein
VWTDFETLKEREVAQIGVKTPLLVPSFSSRGFPDVAGLLSALRPDLQGRVLVSAFDIRKRGVPKSIDLLSDVVVVDSGGYESALEIVASDGFQPLPSAGGWTRSEYHEVIRELPPHANALVVNLEDYAPVSEQVRLAREDFSCASSLGKVFLLKPEKRRGFLAPRSVVEAEGLLGEVDVLGVTERELGDSILARCVALRRIRADLERMNLKIPVHVFGAITPGIVLAYWLSGADIFDGLNWLRFEYSSQRLTCLSDAFDADPHWDQPDDVRLVATARSNLRLLRALEDRMRRMIRLGRADELAAHDSFVAGARLAEAARVAHRTGR